MEHYEDERLSAVLFGDGSKLYIDTEVIETCPSRIVAARLAKYDDAGEILSVTRDVAVRSFEEKSIFRFLLEFVKSIEVVNEFEDEADYLSHCICVETERRRFTEIPTADFIRKAQREYSEHVRIAQQLTSIFSPQVLDALAEAYSYTSAPGLFKDFNSFIEFLETELKETDGPEFEP